MASGTNVMKLFTLRVWGCDCHTIVKEISFRKKILTFDAEQIVEIQ